MMVLTATITCPHCGFARVETMPATACVHFYECTGCGHLLRPNPGDCCVFCSLRVHRLRSPAAAKPRRLLRVLLVRVREVPAAAGPLAPEAITKMIGRYGSTP